MEWLTFCSSKDRIERTESQGLTKGWGRRGREAHFLIAEKFCKRSGFLFLGGREVERRMSIYKEKHTHTHTLSHPPHTTPPPEACSMKLDPPGFEKARVIVQGWRKQEWRGHITLRRDS